MSATAVPASEPPERPAEPPRPDSPGPDARSSPPESNAKSQEARAVRLRTDLARGAQVFLGLFSVGFAIVVLATLEYSINGLLLLLGETVVLLSAQTLLAGGRVLSENWFRVHAPQSYWWRSIPGWGLVGLGILGFAGAAFAVLDPRLAGTAATFILASVLILLGFGRIMQAAGVAAPLWLRGSLLSTGALILLFVVIAITFEGLALTGFAILVGLLLLATGIETVVTGLHPTDPRQFVLLKLILFSAFYGLFLINWIDLFGKEAPAYGIWLILTYMAPFMVLIVFEGWRSWPLAVSLGLLVSLMNDLGYYFVGNLLFGFHVNLGPWILGQLGFRGNDFVTYFNAGAWGLSVSSWMMGLSIYLRIAVVTLILLYWWRHPTEIVARTEPVAPWAPT